MDPKKLLDEIKSKLVELSGMVSGSELEEGDKKSLAGLVQGFDAFYESMVGSGPEAETMKDEPELAIKPANVGKGKVQPMMSEPGIG